jgi:signal peptidase II
MVEKITKNTYIATSIIMLLIIIDQITKFLFTDKTYLKNFLIHIQYTQNTGSSFGIFSQANYYTQIIIILSIIVTAILAYNYKKFKKDKFLLLFFIFASSGIIANTIDRLIFGFVRDFIALKYLFIFNLADLYITLAIIFLLIREYSENKYLKNEKIHNKYGK